MKDFDFLRNVTIGQYLPTNSVLHRLHPGTKMMIVAVMMIALIISSSLSGLAFSLVLLAIGFAVAKIPVGFALSGLKPAIPILVLVAVLQILFVSPRDDQAIWQWWIIRITPGSFLVALITALRLVVLILIVSLFTMCTAARELTHGTERIVRPLARLGFPAHDFSMVVTITLRFLPILSVEAENLVKAQMSRGADFGSGRRAGVFKRLFRMMPLFIPLFISSLRRGENMVLAMEARGYSGSADRTRMIRYRSGRADVIVFLVVCLAAAIILVLHFARADTHIWSAVT